MKNKQLVYIKNAEEFKKFFDLKDEYERFTILNDVPVGFSVQRKYPIENFRYYPPKNRDGTDDTVALFHVIYKKPKSNDNLIISKVPIILRVSTFSRYRNEHFDYDFDDDNCPTKESIEKSNNTPQPIDIENENTYYFDHNLNRIVDGTNSVFSGKKLLDEIYNKHINTVHLVKGLKIRTKIKTKSKFIYLLKVFINILTWILKKGFGRTLDEKNNLNLYLHGYKKEDFKKLTTDSFEIFNYKASRGIIIIFCGIVILLYLARYFFNLKFNYLTKVSSNQFVLLVHSIFFLYLLDVIIPNIIFFLLNRVIKYRTRLLFKKTKV